MQLSHHYITEKEKNLTAMLLSPVSKLFEIIIAQQITNYFHTMNKLFSKTFSC